MMLEIAIVALTLATMIGIIARAWLSDRREQRAETRYASNAEERKQIALERKQNEDSDLKAGLTARKLQQEKELKLEELKLEDERKRYMSEIGVKGRTQRQANSEQDEAMMEALGAIATEYVQPNADKEALKAQAMEIVSGNVVTLLRLLKKMGIDPRSLMG